VPGVSPVGFCGGLGIAGFGAPALYPEELGVPPGEPVGASAVPAPVPLVVTPVGALFKPPWTHLPALALQLYPEAQHSP